MAKAFKIKKRAYIHIDRPFWGEKALVFASSPELVASWSFLPLIHSPLTHKKIKKVNGELVQSDKTREIFYASHKDAAIYALYANALNKNYNAELKRLGIDCVPTAFRSGLGKCNIDFAFEVFEFIRIHQPCEALAYDVVKFFDNLDHRILKERWKTVINNMHLPDDHYAVFKSLTKFSYVEKDDLYRLFRISKHNPKANHRLRACSIHGFKKLIQAPGLVHRNRTPGRGIPQGTPISAVLSNIYMLESDREVAFAVAGVGGLYRRYCDDIICVVPSGKGNLIDELVSSLIKKNLLSINRDKTVRLEFPLDGRQNKNLQYLGFTFDGDRILLRTVGLSRYYAKMRAAVRLAAHTRQKWDAIKGISTPIKRRKLYVKHAYVGRRNYLSYGFDAAKAMGSEAIKNQLKRHWKMVSAQIAIVG
jgi:RNA-directed DNA polymerase